MTRSATAGHPERFRDAEPATREGPYLLIRQLGCGGCAEVFLARRPGRYRYVAVKRLLPQYLQSAERVDMLRREADLGSLMQHPNVVRVLDFGADGGQLMLVMEYVDGVSAKELTQLLRSRGRSCPMPAAVHIARELLNALEYVHEVGDGHGPLGVVHRDVSHANVLVRRDGRVKLADFGVAQYRREAASRAKFIVGKFGYMSPEQARGDAVDERSDLFSVAVLLAELLLWRKLFPGATEAEIRDRASTADLSVLRQYGHELPACLRVVLITALQRDPRARFGSAREMREALEDAAERLELRLGCRAMASLMEGWLL